MSVRTIFGRLTGGRTRPRQGGVDEVHALRDSRAVLIDGRTRQEYRAGHAPGAKNITVDRFGERLSEIPTERAVVTICQSGGRSARAAALLSRHGVRDVYDVRGGMDACQRTGLPVQRS